MIASRDLEKLKVPFSSISFSIDYSIKLGRFGVDK